MALFHLYGRVTDVQWEKGMGRLTSVHPLRCFVALVGAGCRIAVALILLINGTTWLCFTTSLSNLLLNTSALAFLLDVDENLFQLAAPHTLQNSVDAFEPLKVPNFPGRQLVPFSSLAVVVGIVILVARITLVPFLDEMDIVVDILCGGNLDFVIAVPSARTGVFWAQTAKYDASSEMFKDGRFAASQAIMHDWDPEERYAAKQDSLATLYSIEAYTFIDSVANLGVCHDLAHHVGSRMYVTSNIESFNSLSTCTDLKEHCDSSAPWAKNLRFLCPETCGCLKRDSGMLFFNNLSEGCFVASPGSQDCEMTADTKKPYCQDYSFAELQSITGWSKLLHHLASPRAHTYFNMTPGVDAVQKLTNLGCSGLRELNLTLMIYICATYNTGGAGFFCPESCLCSGASGDFKGCPKACAVSPSPSPSSQSPSPSLN